LKLYSTVICTIWNHVIIIQNVQLLREVCSSDKEMKVSEYLSRASERKCLFSINHLLLVFIHVFICLPVKCDNWYWSKLLNVMVCKHSDR
jgi:hypothetical protein